jgi:hypothetical protein
MQYLCGTLSAAILSAAVNAGAVNELRVATFSCDVTPPLGQPMMAGDLLRTVERPLLAKGIVVEAGAERYVLCALDWCELCNGAYDELRNEIAASAGADVAHVAVQCVHQHTAPLVDISAQKLLAEAGTPTGIHIDPKAFEDIEHRLVAAVERSLVHFEPFDQIGTGQAKVDRVASTRRPVDETGKICPRLSSDGGVPAMRALPEGAIDPYLKSITLARNGKPLVRLHYYATHPQTFYGDGRASSDMVGDAREGLQQKEGVFQIYFNGCGGDITMGKYNDGSKQCRIALAKRLLAGMEASLAATKFVPAAEIRWRTCPLLLPRRTDAGFTMGDALGKMKDAKLASVVRLASGGVQAAFLERCRQPIELSCLRIGSVRIVHLPGEPMVCFQLFAQGLKPEAFVAVAGYGDGGPGYLCSEKAFAEGGYEPTASRVKPESETALKDAITALLGDD